MQLPITPRRGASRAALTGLLTIAVTLALSAGGARSQGAAEQSEALFRQMAIVLQHPRCMNCHTAQDYPRQGDDEHRHTLNVSRGPDNRGAPGLHCSTCHQAFNQISSGVPGVPDWRLAPIRMAWEGLSVGELCRALLDPARGGMKPDQFVPHFDTALVRWAWAAGTDSQGRARTPPPIGHDEFIEITKRWIASGAACPKS